MLALAALASCDSGAEPRTPQRPASPPAVQLVLPMGKLRLSSGERSVTVQVEIAETPRARQHGLMGRRHLPPNSGMAFLFDRPTENRFWMKNTLIPLSIAFWDEAGRIVSIVDMAPCPEDPCPLYSAGTSYIGAVEVNRGFFRAHGVEVGDRVELQR